MSKPEGSGTLLFLIIVTYLAFISLGLPDGLLGIAWPFMSSKYDVPLDALGILLIGFTCGYLSTSSISGKILKVLSLGMILTISCLVTGLSLLTYAYSPNWYLIIVASFFLGSGGGAIDSSINTFAAARYKPSTINWLHAFYGIGATTGPLLVTVMLANNFQWFHGYIIVALIQISLSVLFYFTRKNWIVTSEEKDDHSGAGYFHTLKQPVVWLNVLIFFLYTGIEQGFGQWIFSILTKSRGVNEETAGFYTSAYWASLTAGRIVFGIILTKIPVSRVLNGAFVGIVAGTVLVTLNINEFLSLTGILILGFANAPVFPSLISITADRVGKEHTGTAIGLQISLAMIGASVVPGFAGLLSDRFGLEVIPEIFSIASLVLMVLYFGVGIARKRKLME